MKRRDFLETGLLATGVAIAGGAAAAETAAAAAKEPAGAAAESAAAGMPAAAQAPFALQEATIADLQARMASGELTARAIAELYLERIDALDKRGPAVNAIIELNPDAVAIATRLDEERRAGGPRGPLHGIPIIIKDNIDTADRMQTTAGSMALAGSIAPEDSFGAWAPRGSCRAAEACR